MLLKEVNAFVSEQNPFIRMLNIQVTNISNGKAEATMPVMELHTNIHKTVHGGAIATLADTVMGLTCATVDKRVVTIDMSINYIRSVGAPNTLKAIGMLLHAGHNTMVVEAEVLDVCNKLIAKARGTFFVVGDAAEVVKASVI